MEGITNGTVSSVTWLNPFSCRKSVNSPLVAFMLCVDVVFFFPFLPTKGGFGRWIKLFSFHL